MDIKKITERDWEKYKRMRKIATSNVQFYLYILLYLAVIIIFVVAILNLNSTIRQMPSLNTSAIPALSMTNHTLLPLNALNNSKAYNQTLATLISNNTKQAQAILYVASMSTVGILLGVVISMLALLFVMMIALAAIDNWFFSPIRDKPTSYKHLRRSLENKERQKQEMTNRLLAANYTEKDVAWYFDMEDSLKKYDFTA